MSGIAVDSDDIHSGESEQDKTAVLSKLSSGVVAGFGNGSSSSGSAVVIRGQCGNESSTQQTGDFDKDKTPIYDSVLERIHPGLTGMHTCTAMSSLFSSVFES